jgi:hypothetical protein
VISSAALAIWADATSAIAAVDDRILRVVFITNSLCRAFFSKPCAQHVQHYRPLDGQL